jgi:hypothetical protein
MIGIALMGAGRMVRTHAKAIGAAGGKLVTVYDVASLPLPLAGLGHIALTRPHPTLLLQSLAGVRGDQADSADQALPADRTHRHRAFAAVPCLGHPSLGRVCASGLLTDKVRPRTSLPVRLVIRASSQRPF